MTTTLDDVPVNRFHRRLVAVAMGGPFCDGYLLGIIAIALSQITPSCTWVPCGPGCSPVPP